MTSPRRTRSNGFRDEPCVPTSLSPGTSLVYHKCDDKDDYFRCCDTGSSRAISFNLQNRLWGDVYSSGEIN